MELNVGKLSVQVQSTVRNLAGGLDLIDLIIGLSTNELKCN